MREEWRDVTGWKGHYQVSSLGRVRSVLRTVIYSDGRIRRFPGVLMKKQMTPRGYLKVQLSRSGSEITRCVYQLVARAFLGPRRGRDVDHINRRKVDDRAVNLRYVSRSVNKLNVGAQSNNTSGYRGVSLEQRPGRTRKWLAQISVRGKHRWLGRFRTPVEASKAYEAAVAKYIS